MTWWWRRRREQHQGEQAKREAEKGLREERARAPEVKKVTEALKRARERNHFGEAMMDLFRGQA